MARIPSRIQQSAFGTYNPQAPGRAIAPAIQLRGPALPLEQFTDPTIDAATKRALNQIQSNTRQALAQVKGSVFSNGNILAGVELAQGGSDGASPNLLAHGLGVAPTGYAILSTQGGYVTAHALITPSPSTNLIQVWTQFTLFSGASSVFANILVYV